MAISNLAQRAQRASYIDTAADILKDRDVARAEEALGLLTKASFLEDSSDLYEVS